MYLLLLGIALLVLKLLGIEPVAGWTWWVVLSPFGLAALWWKWCDWSGYTQRRIAQRERRRAAARTRRGGHNRDPRDPEDIKADF